jgi:alpha/beta superfamily hydrolase
VCSFDFSGSGKSEGKFTSYGLREKDDICAVLAWLDETHHYDEYVLWGRSMGSVAIILSQALLLNPKVSTIILDSPFSSFEKVSL